MPFPHILAVISKEAAKPEHVKDIGLAAGGISAYFLSKSWQDVVGDFILVATALLITLRILYLIWHWTRGKKPD